MESVLLAEAPISILSELGFELPRSLGKRRSLTSMMHLLGLKNLGGWVNE